MNSWSILRSFHTHGRSPVKQRLSNTEQVRLYAHNTASVTAILPTEALADLSAYGCCCVFNPEQRSHRTAHKIAVAIARIRKEHATIGVDEDDREKSV